MTLVFSGIQPTGNLHLGNYLGAIKNWIGLQDEHKSLLFCIVDLHAITVFQEPKELLKNTRLTAATYVACGIDTKKSSIFPQSYVAAHSELAWLLSTITPLGWLNRMTQFKEKSGKNKDNSCLGLYGYPVLMAADILLYNATHIPVGEDQKQHIELARDIAGAFNRTYHQEYFSMAEPLIMGNATRVMSLRDGSKKMSKSEESDNSRINLTDSNDLIVKKIKKAKSDMIEGINYDVDNRPEASNLLNIYSAITDEKRELIEQKFKDKGFADFKKDLADILVAHIEPIRNKIEDLIKHQDFLDKILKEGGEKANEIAVNNMKNIKDIIGLLRL